MYVHQAGPADLHTSEECHLALMSARWQHADQHAPLAADQMQEMKGNCKEKTSCEGGVTKKHNPVSSPTQFYGLAIYAVQPDLIGLYLPLWWTAIVKPSFYSYWIL